jgi:hypothetical protein
MKMVRQVIMSDAADLHAESASWAGILGGHVFEDDDWHSIIDSAGEWRISVQLAPNHLAQLIRKRLVHQAGLRRVQLPAHRPPYAG